MGGSRPFFWRWPRECFVLARGGRTNYVKSKLPERLARQKFPKNEFFTNVRKK